MALLERRLEVTFTLARNETKNVQKNFTGTSKNTVTLSGLRMSCKIINAGGLSNSTMQMTIYGLSLSIMNDLSTLGVQINLIPKNSIIVTAGDAKSGMGTVFAGYVTFAWAAFKGAPDVSFQVMANTGLPDRVIPAVSSSFKGPVDVATLMSGFATKMQLKFENNGVTTKLPSAYFYGPIGMQAQDAVTKAGIEWNHGEGGVLAIWPKGKARGGSIPLISPETGMVGYPIYTKYGIMIETLFNPSIGFGGQIQVKSSLKQATGLFNVYSLDHDLDTLMPDGKWFSTIGASNPAHPTPLVKPAQP